MCCVPCLQVTKALIDMENMFELLATQPRVRDARQAATLQIRSGRVEFQQVGALEKLLMPASILVRV